MSPRRLRHALADLMHESKNTEHSLSGSLNSAMVSKMHETRRQRQELVNQLQMVDADREAAEVEKQSLIEFLDAEK